MLALLLCRAVRRRVDRNWLVGYLAGKALRRVLHGRADRNNKGNVKYNHRDKLHLAPARDLKLVVACPVGDERQSRRAADIFRRRRHELTPRVASTNATLCEMSHFGETLPARHRIAPPNAQ